MKKSGANGFTLIEVLIAVIIIGIIAGIAYPNYVKFVTEARRSDATTNLTRIAALQNRFYLTCNPVKYAANFGAANSCVGAGTLKADLTGNITRDGHYIIVIASLPVAEGGLANLATDYKLIAIPTGSQLVNDGSKVSAISLSSTGQKSAVGTEAASAWKH